METVGVVAAIIGVVLMIGSGVVYFQNKQRKQLTYQLVANRITTPDIQNLQLTYNNKPVVNASQVLLELRNEGNTPIAAEDFEDWLVFSMGSKAEILSIEATSNRKTMKALCDNNGSSVAVQPLLLNPNDTILITMLVSGFEHVKLVSGRIKGVEEVNEAKQAGLFMLTKKK